MNRNDDGFFLLEAAVTVALLSVMSATMFLAARSAIRSCSASHSLARRRLVEEQLVADLRYALLEGEALDLPGSIELVCQEEQLSRGTLDPMVLRCFKADDTPGTSVERVVPLPRRSSR